MNNIIILFYLLMNLFFLNTVYNNYPNIVLLFSTICLWASELMFWGLQIYNVNMIEQYNNYINKLKNKLVESDFKVKFNINDWIVIIMFLLVMSLTGIVRILMYSSVYINDLVLHNMLLIILIGSIHLMNIFMAMVFIYYIADKKNKIMLIIAILNFIISVLIWVELDSNITAVLRILISLLALYLFYSIKKIKVNIGGLNEENNNSNDDNNNINNG